MLTLVLADNRELHTPSGDIAIGWLIVEDIFTILVLVLLPALSSKQEGRDTSLWLRLSMAIGKLVLLLVFALIAGQKLLPLLLH